MRLLTVLVVIFVLAGCDGARSNSANNTLLEGTSSTTRAPLPQGHVFLIMLENKTYDKALGENYTASLASNYAVATNYHAVAHPSLPNYLVLTSGSTWDVVDDGYHVLPSEHDLGSELSSAGIPWRAYMEDMSEGCFDSKYPYALKHNPFAYYGGQCSSNVVDLSQLDADLAGNTP